MHLLLTNKHIDHYDRIWIFEEMPISCTNDTGLLMSKLESK